jgi:hypothetical protein
MLLLIGHRGGADTFRAWPHEQLADNVLFNLVFKIHVADLIADFD